MLRFWSLGKPSALHSRSQLAPMMPQEAMAQTAILAVGRFSTLARYTPVRFSFAQWIEMCQAVWLQCRNGKPITDAAIARFLFAHFLHGRRITFRCRFLHAVTSSDPLLSGAMPEYTAC
jgi:hypothetical protein